MSSERGLQYDIETELVKAPTGWQIRWRKVFLTNGSGCGGCSTCQDQSLNTPIPNRHKAGKVILFNPKRKQENAD